MDIEIIKLFLQIAVSVSAAFLAPWLSTILFRDERWWERKAVSYSELVETLHKMKWPSGEHFEAALENRTLSEQYSEELWCEFKDARRNV